jgi:hypothetical protein
LRSSAVKFPYFSHALVRLFQIMLPNPHHPPPALAQGAVHEPIPRPVRRQFLAPKRTVGDRQIRMPGTAMPEAAIHKHGQPIAAKNEVRLAEDGLQKTPWALSLLVAFCRSLAELLQSEAIALQITKGQQSQQDLQILGKKFDGLIQQTKLFLSCLQPLQGSWVQRRISPLLPLGLVAVIRIQDARS